MHIVCPLQLAMEFEEQEGICPDILYMATCDESAQSMQSKMKERVVVGDSSRTVQQGLLEMLLLGLPPL